MWAKDGRRSWTYSDGSVQGRAAVHEMEGGYKAVVEITDKDFGMDLVSKEEFFQSEQEAMAFVREAMEEAV
ncbi:MAG: hypothetical protein SV186_03700 [Candidatus Nanohaloarchaea archaeon]|nr:hypothetical protein [Candidatus Nanohaloarchaea archaeon]